MGAAYARRVMNGAFDVMALLAIDLEECSRVLEHLPMRRDLAEELRHLGLDAAIARDVDLPAGIDADDAHVLDARLGAVARAARYRELHLVRRVHAPEGALELLPHAR